MAEYIEKEAAFNAILKLIPKVDDDGYCWVIRGDAAKAIDFVPAADVAPVRHGRYIGEYDGFADGSPVYDMWYCSECGCYFEEWDEKPTYNYCPNCGAKMVNENE